MAKKWNGQTKTLVAVVTLLFLAVGTLMSVAKTYFLIPNELDHHITSAKEFYEENDTEHTALEAADGVLREKCSDMRNDMTEIKTEIKYLREDVKEILQYVKEQRNSN